MTSRGSMLYGREEERALVAGLLAGARQGRGGVLVVRGEAGIGKRSLLQDAAEHATGFQVLRGAGAEPEAQLAYAGLHQLLQPALGQLDRLPGPQANALGGAFGLVEGPACRSMVANGVLSLLARLGRERPVLCLVGEAQWLDRASAEALVFTGRRLDTEPVVLLLAAEDGGGRRFDAPDLPSLRLGGLDRDAAGQLLADLTGAMAPAVADQLIDRVAGHPLALVELAATLSGEQLAGRAPLPEPLALGTRLQRAFLPSVRRLPAATRTLLLVASVEGTGNLAAVLAAAADLGVGPEALEPAEQVGLVRAQGSRLMFRHPLVRSAIHQGATFVERRAAHRALAGELTDEPQADRRAWHLAAATVEPDEEVAAALEASAVSAARRGGPTAAAAALERAATLTPEPGPRARRLLAAAEHSWEGGLGQRARLLLDRVQPPLEEPAMGARLRHLEGRIELATGSPASACRLLSEGADLAVGPDPDRAAELLALAGWAALAADQPTRVVDRLGPATAGLPGDRGPRVGRVADSLVAAELAPGPPDAARRDLSPEPATVWPRPSHTWAWPMLLVAEPAADGFAAADRYAGLVAARRAAGADGALAVALANLLAVEACLGRWPAAIRTATEGLQTARAAGQHALAPYFLVQLAWFAAQQGRADDCRRLAGEALGIAATRRLPLVAASASWDLAQLDLVDGRPRAALDRLLALASPGHPTAHGLVALLATGDLVEAAVRTGAIDGIGRPLVRFERWAERDKDTWGLATAARCRALLTQGDAAERHFGAALAIGGLDDRPFELARTELAYGEWLRRARRRGEARAHLRRALELFGRLEAAPWAERARIELGASGETARKRDPSTIDQLTPQERQVAGLAVQGLTNQQIAERLLLSRHTVGYHLHKAFAKLGVESRARLRQVDLDDRGR
jgi:DNA-binding CsgD family transcriptional regulator